MTAPDTAPEAPLAKPADWWARQTLHHQLSWIHGALILLLLFIFSVALLLTARNLLYADLDHQLHRDAEAAQQALSWNGQAWQEQAVSHSDDDPFDTDPHFEVWSREGRLQYQSLAKTNIAQQVKDLQLASPGIQRKNFSLPTPSGQALRVGVEPMRVAAQEVVLRVYRSEIGLQTQLRNLALVLLGALMLAAAMAAWLSWWFTRRALMPLRALVRSLEQTQSPAHWLAMNLSQRPSSSEVQALLRSIEDLGARLKESYAQLDGFAAQCAHELRTPLTALHMRCEWLSNSGLPVQRDDLGALLEQMDRLALLVDRLLALARTPSSMTAERFANVDLAQIAQRVVVNLRPVLEERGQDITLQAQPTQALTDPLLVEQILMDLLHNASLYAPANALVEITVGMSGIGSGCRPQIIISDAGAGPAPAALDRAGVPWAGEPAAPNPSLPLTATGTGLGLRFVARTMQLLGGRIRAEYPNAPSAMGRFRLVLRW